MPAKCSTSNLSIPFTSGRRPRSSLSDGRTFSVTKGAPQVILALAANADQIRASVDQAVNEFAARGYRALGVAQTDDAGPMAVPGHSPAL